MHLDNENYAVIIQGHNLTVCNKKKYMTALVIFNMYNFASNIFSQQCCKIQFDPTNIKFVTELVRVA
jgi:hypothetical protein